MDNNFNTSGFLGRERFHLDELDRHLDEWNWEEEREYRTACYKLAREAAYPREVWELTPFITYMALSRKNLESKVVRKEIEYLVEATIQFIQNDLQSILAEVDRVFDEEERVVRQGPREKAKDKLRAEAR